MHHVQGTGASLDSCVCRGPGILWITMNSLGGKNVLINDGSILFGFIFCLLRLARCIN